MTQLKIVMPVLFAAACFIILIEILFPDGFSYLWATGKVITFICLYLIFLYLTKSDVLNELNYYKKKISIKLRKK